jgi:chromosome segregation ATPase
MAKGNDTIALKTAGISTINQMYFKHYGRVTSARRILAHLGEVIESSETAIGELKAEVGELKTELEKLREMVSAKSDQATTHTNRRGKRNGNH